MSKMAFIFPGQGSQYVGMGRDIYDLYAEAREVFDQASEAVALDLKTLCFHGPEEALSLTINTQPAIVTASVALWMCLGNPDAEFLAGHSLGEFTALIAGGALDLQAAISLVRDRGLYMQEAVPPGAGGMAAILGLADEIVDKVCRDAWDAGRVWPANYNCPGQVVISGERQGVLKAMDLAQKEGALRSVLLPVSIPSHSPLMEGAALRFSERLKQIDLRDPGTPVVSNCSAAPVVNKGQIVQNLREQLTSPVRWEESVRLMIDKGVTRFVEVGPGKVLAGLVKRIDKGIEVMSCPDVKGIERVKEALQ